MGVHAPLDTRAPIPAIVPARSAAPRKALTFVIPIRHPENLRDPEAQIAILERTFASIAAQSDPAWRAVIVANHGTPLPQLPRGFEIAWVDFEPNLQHELRDHDFHPALNQFLIDKGRRVWAGIRKYPASDYFMVLDDDDFVCRDLTAFVAARGGGNGWYIDRGFGIDPGGMLAMSLDRFHKICGSSHIVRGDLYDLPAADDPGLEDYVMTWLGAHGGITERFESIGKPLAPLPFPGAVYMVNNPNSHSNSNSMLRQYVINKDTLRRPWSLPGKLSRLKRVNRRFRAEFLGGS